MTDSRAGFDYRAIVTTDGAQIILADPARLLEHRHDPLGWQNTAGGTIEDRQNGHFLYFSTGGDGGFEVRVTDRPLEPRESEHAAGSIVLRLRVGQTGLLLDGGYAWPDESTSELDDSLGSYLDVPTGDYAAKITVIGRPIDSEYHFTDVDDPEEPLVDYVIQLEKVKDFTDVPMMEASPSLIAFESPAVRPFDPMSHFNENCSEVPMVAILRPIENDQLPSPGGNWKGRIPLALFEYVNAEQSSDTTFGLEHDGAIEYGFFGYSSNLPVIVASSSLPGTVGALISVYARSRLPGENDTVLTELYGTVRCAVTISGPSTPPDGLDSLGNIVDFVSIVALPLDAAKPEDVVSAALVNAYTGWLERSDRRDVRYRLATVSEIVDPRHRFSEIVQHIEPPAGQLAQWIAADAVSRDKALTSWLEQQYRP